LKKLERLHQSGNESLDLFGNLTSGTISGSVEITGNISASGGITASDIWASGDIHAVGNITFEAGAGGTITLGDSAADNVVFGADVQSSIIPDSNDTYDLGSTGQRWNNLWMSGSLTANGGPHSLTTEVGEGGAIDIDADGALTIDGGSITIGGDADVVVDVDASSFDLDSSGAISLDSSAGSIDINVVDGQTVAIGLNGGVETLWKPHGTAGSELWSTINTAGTTDGTDAAGAILLSAVAGGIGLAWADDKDLWAEGGQFVVTANHDTSGAIKLHADAGSSQSIIILNDAGTNAAAIDIQATAGGIDIDAGSSVDILAASTLSVIGSDSATFGDDTEALVYDGSGNLDIDSVVLDIDASGAVTIDGTSTFSVDVDGATNINTSVGNITVDSEAGSLVLDGHTGVDIDASNSGKVAIDGAGGIDIGVNADVAIDVDANTFDLDAAGALTIDSATSIAIGANADKPIDIDSTTLDIDASDAITIDSTSTILISGDGGATFSDDTEALVYDGSGNVDFDTVGLDIDSSGAITIDGTGTVSIDGADDMNFTITSGTAGEDLTIAQLGANDSSIFITAAGTGTDAISIDATAGDMLIAPNLINGKTLTIGPSSATQMVFTPHGTAANEKISLINTSGTADDAIKIDSVAGGLTLAAGNDSLHIDADGTDADALNIDSAGGIDVDAIAGLTITSTTMAFDPSSTFDLDAAGAITIDGSSITLGGDADTAFDIDTSTLDIDASDEITIDAGSSSGISLDASAASNFTTSTGALTLAGVSLDVDATGGAFNIAATAASTVTTSGGALTLDGETGINIQENGTTIISVDDSRDIVVGNATNAETIRIGHSTSEVTVGDNLTVTGNLNVAGTETIVDSNVVNISDNIIQVNTGGAKRKGGLQVIDTDGDQTGSVVWDSDGNYFEVGLSGSEYRLPELATSTELSANNNKVLISDGARIDASATITDDGTTVDISNRVDAQASLQVTGSLYVSAGASVASSLASLVSFRNNGSTQLGYLASANTSAVTTGLIGYNASTGNLTVSSVIDGGSF